MEKHFNKSKVTNTHNIVEDILNNDYRSAKQFLEIMANYLDVISKKDAQIACRNLDRTKIFLKARLNRFENFQKRIELIKKLDGETLQMIENFTERFQIRIQGGINWTC